LAIGFRFYDSDAERWEEIDRVRRKVAESICVPHSATVLDVLVGEGDLARAVALSSIETCVVAGEILVSDLREARRRIERDRLKERVELLRLDVTYMPFAADSFDYVVNFCGWEDFTAISGEELIPAAFREMTRVLKKNGTLAVTFTPRYEAQDEMARKDKELQEYLYKSSKRPEYFEEGFFLSLLKKHGIARVKREAFETVKSRLKPQDAMGKLQWMCSNYKTFYSYGVEMRDYEDILAKFGEFIERHGIREQKSKFVLMVGEKT
jgi:ubiquinone/menaquinone biosynthesis C-methylase UbiE